MPAADGFSQGYILMVTDSGRCRIPPWSYSEVSLEAHRIYSGKVWMRSQAVPCGGRGSRDGEQRRREGAAAAFGHRFYFHLFIEVEQVEAHTLLEQVKL